MTEFIRYFSYFYVVYLAVSSFYLFYQIEIQLVRKVLKDLIDLIMSKKVIDVIWGYDLIWSFTKFFNWNKICKGCSKFISRSAKGKQKLIFFDTFKILRNTLRFWIWHHSARSKYNSKMSVRLINKPQKLNKIPQFVSYNVFVIVTTITM